MDSHSTLWTIGTTSIWWGQVGSQPTSLQCQPSQEMSSSTGWKHNTGWRKNFRCVTQFICSKWKLTQYPFTQTIKGCVHLSHDLWSLPNCWALVAYVIQYAFQGKIHSYLLDVVQVSKVSECQIYFFELWTHLSPKCHTGQTLANVTQGVLEDWGIQHRVSSHEYDHATSLLFLLKD